MATANAPYSTEISEIQRRMAQIRREMHQDVQGAVKGAQSLTDWRSLVRSHPWLALGVAAAAGYLIVPKRFRESRTLMSSTAPIAVAQPAGPRQSAGSARAEASTIGTVFSLVAPVAIRAAQNYALKRFEQWLEQHPLHTEATRRGALSESEGRSAAPAPAAPRLRIRDSR